MSITALEIHPPTIHEPQPSVPHPSTDERPLLPSIGYDISRPPSTSSQVSNHHIHRWPSPMPGLQLPGLSQLSALASIATSTRTSPDSIGKQPDNHVLFRQTLTPPAMSTATPPATIGPGGSAPLCQNCDTSTTPLWRRDENGSVLCNACGLFLKLHGRSRPISLKTNVIKSRNRVRAANGTANVPVARKKPNDGGPVKHADSVDQASAAVNALRRVVEPQLSVSQALRRSKSPVSRIGTPGDSHPANIAPQSMFDSVSLEHQTPFFTTSMQDPSFRTASPLSRIDNNTFSDGQQAYALLFQQKEMLQMRVNELDVINSLFKGRVAELEEAQDDLKAKQQAAREAEEAALAREVGLKRRLEELESELSAIGGRPAKKSRLAEPSNDEIEFINSSPIESI